MTQAAAIAAPSVDKGGRDIAFAAIIVCILCVFFLPIPAFLIDMGLAFSIALSVLILMVSLWIEKPLEFSAFPTILLVATMLRLSLNIATTRLILTDGSHGVTAAGYIIGGFARLVMGGDFVIGLVVFAILITVNFLVITKGATRIAEVGARFTLDAIPGKQMAIDADLSAGMINDKEAQQRRRELEEESSFFGAMDGASKFVRGDAIAGLIILAVNIFGGIVIGVTRHSLDVAAAADVYTKLSVGDGLVTQIPALIVSLAAGLLVSKGGTRGSTEKAVLDQLGNYPRAMLVASALLFLLGCMPMLPFIPFATLSGALAYLGRTIPQKLARERKAQEEAAQAREEAVKAEAKNSVKESLRTHEIELVLGKQLSARLMLSQNELSTRVARMRRKFAVQYGFVVPEIKVSNSLTARPKCYQFKIHGAIVATQDVRIGEYLVISGDGKRPDTPGEEVREPAFGMKAWSIVEAFVAEARRSASTRSTTCPSCSPTSPRSSATISRRCSPTRTCARCSTASVRNTSGCSMKSAPRRSPIRACRRCSNCCCKSASPSATCISSSKPSPRSRRTRAAPSRSPNTCACAWRSRSAATSRRAAC